MTRASEILSREEGAARLEINPMDAAELGVKEGQEVRMKSRRGEVTLKVKPTTRVPQGVLYTSFHFAESPVNRLTNPARDPVAKCPEYKVCAVALESVST